MSSVVRSLFSPFLLAFPVLAFAQGSLAPSAAPEPTMKTLDQIEPRIPVHAIPGGRINAKPNGGFEINAAGSYYLTDNVYISSGDGITIWAPNVTLDLNGFAIMSSAYTSFSGTAIKLENPADITIRNGQIRGSATINPITGDISGGGFENGIVGSSTVYRCHASDLTVTGCHGFGINLDKESSTIDHCIASNCGASGLTAAEISHSTLTNGVDGLYGNTVTDCSAISLGVGIAASQTAANCYGKGTNGVGISAIAVLNSYGISSLRAGISATEISSSYGFSSGAAGIDGKTVATSYGKGATKPGITATAVSNCHGESVDDCGITCTTAENSFGSSTNSTGLSAATATNCYGYSYNGWGLYATEATTCHGKSEHGTRGLHAENTATGCTGEIVESSSAMTAYGLFAGNAGNCTGSILATTANSGACYGLEAMNASNCLGSVADHPRYACGLDALNAANCYGAIGSHTGAAYIMPGLGEDPSVGLHAARATNSYGSDKSGRYGLTATFSASFCTGFSFSGAVLGTAIKTNLAIGCTSEMGSIVATQKLLGTP